MNKLRVALLAGWKGPQEDEEMKVSTELGKEWETQQRNTFKITE